MLIDRAVTTGLADATHPTCPSNRRAVTAHNQPQRPAQQRQVQDRPDASEALVERTSIMDATVWLVDAPALAGDCRPDGSAACSTALAHSRLKGQSRRVDRQSEHE